MHTGPKHVSGNQTFKMQVFTQIFSDSGVHLRFAMIRVAGRAFWSGAGVAVACRAA
jgi:hypothetical protein